MGKHRRAAKIDNNQPHIVRELRKIPGITVELDHDDILVGYKGNTYWYEIKNPNTIDKNGDIRESAIKEDQKRIRASFTGHYRILASLDDILADLNLTEEI